MGDEYEPLGNGHDAWIVPFPVSSYRDACVRMHSTSSQLQCGQSPHFSIVNSRRRGALSHLFSIGAPGGTLTRNLSVLETDALTIELRERETILRSPY